MAVTFKNAPLIEIVAELRWLEPEASGVITPGKTVQLKATSSNKLDEFFMRFGGAAYKMGFERAERQVPSGFPMIVGTPVYRYKPAEGADVSMPSALLQIGPGLFSANAVPPYKSWDEFGPVVRNSVAALIATRKQFGDEKTFDRLSLRYIDSFTPRLMGDSTPFDFVHSVLGFVVSPPTAFSKLSAADGGPKVSLTVSSPAKNGMQMTVSVREQEHRGENVVIFDTTVASVGPVQSDLEAVMKGFEDARQIISEIFYSVTERIRDRMGPMEN